MISCVKSTTWAARKRGGGDKTFFWWKARQHNQSEPSPFPDDEIIIPLTEICFGICRLPMYILHTSKTIWQCELRVLICCKLYYKGSNATFFFGNKRKSLNVSSFWRMPCRLKLCSWSPMKGCSDIRITSSDSRIAHISTLKSRPCNLPTSNSQCFQVALKFHEIHNESASFLVVTKAGVNCC